MTKKLTYNFLLKSLTISTEIIYSFFCFPIIANRLGVNAVGEVDYYIGLSSYFLSIITFGTTEFGIRESRKANGQYLQQRKIFTYITSIKFLMLLPSLIIYFTFFKSFFAKNEILFYFCSITLFTSAFNSSWYLDALEKYSFVSIVRFLTKIAMFFLIIFSVHSSAEITKFLLISVLAEFVFSVILLFKSVRLVGGVDFSFVAIKKIKETFTHISWTFLLGLTTSFMGNIALTYIGNHGTYEEVGKFSIANRIFWAAFYVTIPITSVLFVRSMENRENKNDYYTKVHQIKHLLVSSVMVGLYLTSKEIIYILFGKSFMGSVDVLKNLSLLIFLFVFCNFWSMQILYANNKEKVVFVITSSCLLIMASLFWVFETSTALDASHVLLFSYAVMYIIFMKVGRKYYKPKVFCPQNIKSWIAALIMGVVINQYSVVSKIGLLNKVFLGVIVYTITISLLKHELIVLFARELVWKKKKY